MAKDTIEALPVVLDSYHCFVVTKLARAYGGPEEAVAFMVQSWVAEHYDIAVNAGASFADFRSQNRETPDDLPF